MQCNFSGFKRFLEAAGSDAIRPDQKNSSDDKNDMDSLDVQSMELGVSPKDFASVPFVGTNFQLGNKVLGGLASWTVVDINDRTVTLELRDEGNKRFIRTPSGVLARDIGKQDKNKRITISRRYYAKMLDDQLNSPESANAGSLGGAMPPLT